MNQKEKELSLYANVYELTDENKQKLLNTDDDTYEKFFKKYILPIEIKKCNEKEEELKRIYKTNIRNHSYNPLTDEIEILSDDDINELFNINEVSEVPQVNEVRQVNEVSQVNEVNEVSQVNEVNEVSQVNEVPQVNEVTKKKYRIFKN